jgi:hypothetical protein
VASETRVDMLEDKYKTYLKLSQSQRDSDGFIETHECDSLLFSGLLGCVPGSKVNIDAARDAEGKWLRRPVSHPPCYDCANEWILKDRLVSTYKYYKENGFDKDGIRTLFEKGSSSISRDMLVGLAWYAYYNKRLDISEGVIKYALSNKLIMGNGTPTRTLMSPGLLSTYAWISYKLGGPSRWLLRHIPQFESKSMVGFQAHLSVLHILLRNKLTTKNKHKDLLLQQAKRQPNNALFQFAAGHVDAAKALLSNNIWFPEDRLPTAKDRDAQWLWQRDDGDDWLPCDSDKIHSGADFLFCYWLIKTHETDELSLACQPLLRDCAF